MVASRVRARRVETTPVGRVERALVEALQRLSAWPRGRQRALVAGLACASLLLDWWTGPATSMLLGFSLTVAVAAWTLSRSWVHVLAVGMSAASAIMITSSTGNTVPAETVWANATVRAASLTVTALFVRALRAYVERTEADAHTDSLTGVRSRAAIVAELEQMLQSSGSHPVSVVFFDLDDLKRVNDTAGHAEGDALIRRFAHFLRDHVRETDLVGRMGGDEFLLICPNTLATNAVDLVTRMFHHGGAPAVSWGVADTISGSTADRLIEIADQAMYRAKPSRARRSHPDSLPERRHPHPTHDILDRP